MDQKSSVPTPADFARIEGELFERITVRHRRRVLRHRLVAVATVLVLAGAGVAAGTIANPTQQSKFAYCYDGATMTARVAQVVIPTDPHSGTVDPTAQVANALLVCKSIWRGGVFSKGNGTGPFPVPKLQVCLRDDLIVSIFRKPTAGQSAEAFCNNLGLSAP